MGVMDETVEDSVGEGWVSDGLVPVLDGQLAGDDGGSAAVAIFQDFQQIAAFRGGQDGEAQSSMISTSMRAMVLRMRSWRPSLRARVRASNLRGARWYRTGRPSRHALCPRAPSDPAFAQARWGR